LASALITRFFGFTISVCILVLVARKTPKGVL